MAFVPLPFLRVSPAIIAAFLASVMLLLAPAIWNGFPLLFYDSGDYFLRTILGQLNNGRSVVYGAWLTALRYPNFWPAAIVQCAITVWVIYLVLRTHGLRNRPAALPLALVSVVAALSTFSALAWVAGMMMPDLFAALGGRDFAAFAQQEIEREHAERLGLAAVIVFSCAAHNGTLAVVLALLLAAVALHLWRGELMPRAGLKQGAAAILLAILLVPSAGWLVAGQFAWTPGGAGFVFSRLVQDGIAHRYLADNCPDPKLKLCEVRHALPHTADDFLWHQGDRGPFAHIGGFEGGAEEMRSITLDSIVQYPGLHLWTAIRSSLQQLTRVRTGDGVVHDIGFTYGVLDSDAPEMQSAMKASLQRQGKLKVIFERLNYAHEPATLASIALLPLLLLLAWRRGNMRDTDWLAATVILALLANAFVMGALSNPNHRYGARLAWTAPLVWSVLFVQLLVLSRSWRDAAARLLAATGFFPALARRAILAREKRR